MKRLRSNNVTLKRLEGFWVLLLIIFLAGCGRGDLQDAVIRDDLSSVSTLLKNGADPNRSNELGNTPLHFVRSHAVASILIASGADVNARSTNGNTPLHAATAFGSFDVVKTLVANGADVNIKNVDGFSPLHWAVSELVGEAGATESFYAGRQNFHIDYESKYDIAKFLLNNGADPNIMASNGETPLHKAATSWNDSKYVDLLIKSGANISAIGPNGWTPLEHAQANDQQEAAKRLMQENKSDGQAD